MAGKYGNMFYWKEKVKFLCCLENFIFFKRLLQPVNAEFIRWEIYIVSWMKQGEDASIEAAVMAITNCLREPVGPNNCSEVK